MAARLDLGQHHEVVAAAEAAVSDEPLREQRWAVLMLAARTAAGGRPMRCAPISASRAVLGAELGIAPSPGLTQVDAAILRQDESLDRATVRRDPHAAACGGEGPVEPHARVGRRIADVAGPERLAGRRAAGPARSADRTRT